MGAAEPACLSGVRSILAELTTHRVTPLGCRQNRLVAGHCPRVTASVEYNIYASKLQFDSGRQVQDLPLRYYRERHAFMLEGLSKFPQHARLNRLATARLYCPNDVCQALEGNQAPLLR